MMPKNFLRDAIAKAEAKNLHDKASGIARFGGWFRQPKYPESYARASAILYDAARSKDALNENAQPILFLQRHSVELVLKDILRALLEVRDSRSLRAQLFGNDLRVPKPSIRDCSILRRSHDLGRIVRRIQRSLANLDLLEMPQDVILLVGKILACEKGDPSRFRYPFVNYKDSEERSFSSETVVPLLEIQTLLSTVMNGPMHIRENLDFESADLTFREKIAILLEEESQLDLERTRGLQRSTADNRISWKRKKFSGYTAPGYTIAHDEGLITQEEARTLLLFLVSSATKGELCFALGLLQPSGLLEPCFVLEEWDMALVEVAASSAGC